MGGASHCWFWFEQFLSQRLGDVSVRLRYWAGVCAHRSCFASARLMRRLLRILLIACCPSWFEQPIAAGCRGDRKQRLQTTVHEQQPCDWINQALCDFTRCKSQFVDDRL